MIRCQVLRNCLTAATIVASILGAFVSSVHAQFVEYSSGPGAVVTYTFSVSPKAPQPPLMKHRLYPAFSEQFPGNAAPLYQRAILLISQKSGKLESPIEYWQKIDEWRVLPLDQLPLDEVEQVVQLHSGALQEASYAARRSFCDWNLPTREHGVDLFGVMLPEIQAMRTVARLLALRIRLRLAQGRLDEAVADLQAGYAMARHVGNRDFIVNALVGIAISSMMHEQLLTAISVDSVPNLYWSIVNQPNPLIDIRNAIDVERDSVVTIFPELKEAKKSIGDQEYWNQLLLDVIRRVERLRSNKPISLLEDDSSEFDMGRLAYRTVVFSQAARVKEELVEQLGYRSDEVDAMPGSRAILLYSLHAFERQRDAYLAPLGLPYYQAKTFYPAANQFSEDLTSGDPLGISQLLLPSTLQIQQASVRDIRWSSMLQALEAIRDFAAAHGKLPETLDQVDRLPIPNNPFDNQPLRYQWQADKPWEATLEGTSDVLPLRFQLTLRQP